MLIFIGNKGTHLLANNKRICNKNAKKNGLVPVVVYQP